jgi:hypothetical protein
MSYKTSKGLLVFAGFFRMIPGRSFKVFLADHSMLCHIEKPIITVPLEAFGSWKYLLWVSS